MIAMWSSLILLLTGTMGFLIVTVLTIEPLFGLMAIIGLSVLTALLILQPLLPHFYLIILSLTLCGYAFLGRGFAYLGKPPVYVGEFILALGLIAFVLKPNAQILRSRISWSLLLLMFIGTLGTIIHLSTYGIDAMRDAVLWGYGLFALLTASFLLRLKTIWDVVFVYQKWVPWLLFWIPIGMVLYHIANEIIPRWPASDIPVLNPKGGDIAVHLSGAFSFLTLGLYRFGRRQSKSMTEIKEWVLWSMLLVGCVAIFTGRAAILTVLSTSLLILVIRPSIRWAKPVVLVLLLVIVFFAFDLKISLRDDRSISTEAVIETVHSIFNSTGVSYYDGPRQWRIDWWSKILDYTVFGKFFWTGKGYGINLANDDGFQVFEIFHDQPLRSPHNSHLNFLARSGVPGFLAWITLQGMFCISLFGAYRKAVRSGRNDWAVLNLWVLAYWFAFMVNATFDVFLEGPQGGIWFWCVFGFGIALIEVQRSGYPSPFIKRNCSKGAIP
jgi:hypothetical protein